MSPFQTDPGTLKRTQCNRSSRRSGTIYIMAMGTSLIVVCLAIAGLQSVRLQRRINDEASQLANAEKLAQAGIEFAQHRILTDANWRSFFTHGVPETRNTSGGSFSVVLTDPEDGVIANESTDPVVVTCTGTFGSASQKMTAYLEPQTQLFAACRSALYAPKLIEFQGCTINSNQWAYCDNEIRNTSNPDVSMNCLAGSLTGSPEGFTRRAVQGGVWPMDKPDLLDTSSNYVGKYYSDNSVVINASDLPTGGTEMIKNGQFDKDTANWTGERCTLTLDTTQKREGIASCLVSGQRFYSAPVQDITEHMVKGRRYNVSFWIRTTEDQSIRPLIRLKGSEDESWITDSLADIVASKGEWTQVTYTTERVSWEGTLDGAEFWIYSQRRSNFHFDSVSIMDAERQAGTRYIENVVLGSGNNPYGTRTVSPNGIYSINAGTEKLLIRDCRINGTLMVQSASKVELRNGLSWEPSGRNFPALIANAPIDDLTTTTLLRESFIGINTNPASSPYRGVTDKDARDTRPSQIMGAMVSTGDILLSGVSTLSGPVYSGNTINVTSDNLNIDFQSDMILNPPPGFFADAPEMRLIPSSLQSVP
ncbi:MAG: carbohydrate binding domain-containing protein [Planctomycetota bacterium]|nr:carbohydrate binding domain-containing protein [Planctomycetota bacterium]